MAAAYEVTVEEVPDAELQEPTDVLMRVTSTAICGSDLHIYEGRMGEPTGMVIGHEPLGVVEEVGSAVVNVRPGDRVVVPTHICCGFCASCVSGRSAECLTNHPGAAGAAYGYPGMGGYPGTQAELVRVPFGDANCLRLPGEPGDDWEHDFVLLADALPTGYHATELAGVSAGDSVAVFGAGAIGLLAAMCARLRGAADVYVVDRIADRLDKAGEMGFEPIDFMAGDPVEQILAHRRRPPVRAPAAPTVARTRCWASPAGSTRSASRHARRRTPLARIPIGSRARWRNCCSPAAGSASSACSSTPIRARSASPSATACCRSPGARCSRRACASGWAATTTSATTAACAT